MLGHHITDSPPQTPDDLFDGNTDFPGSPDESSEASTPLDPTSSEPSPMTYTTSPATPNTQRRVPSLGKTLSDPQQSTLMNPSSSVCGTLNHARRLPLSAGSLPLDIMQKARALQAQRMGMMVRPPFSTQSSGSGQALEQHAASAASPTGSMGMGGGMPASVPGMAGGLGLPSRPVPPGFRRSAPSIPNAARKPPSLSERRAMKLGSLPGSSSPVSGRPAPKLSDMDGAGGGRSAINGEGRGSNLSDFKSYIDAEKGWVTFEGAATITQSGVNFANGKTFSISLDEVEVLDELGKGNYGTVYKVRHSPPKVPRFGQGLSGPKHPSRQSSMSEKEDSSADAPVILPSTSVSGRTTSGVLMAMKEMRLELDESKFTTILKELVILHECVSPYIIDFYGAFFQEGAVYMCIEYMDGGSIDKIYRGGIPESVLRKITYATVMGLKTLKDDHKIIHRDVKPTNILVNTRGQIKICDFGVSGNLVASIAKTNIGCQSYMAPERISGGGMVTGGVADGTYSVQSDIWSLGLTVIECAMGKYPYPPEVSSTIFSQLSAIVDGEPPALPSEGYSSVAQDFVRACVNKIPSKRHTYPMLLTHPWLKSLAQPETIAEDAEGEEEAAAAAAAQDGGGLAEETGRLNLNTNPADAAGLPVHDKEVAAWVRNALERKHRGVLDEDVAGPPTVRPALHAAPLDTISPLSGPSLGSPRR